MDFQKTAEKVDLNKYFKKWNVAAGRVSMFEKFVKNPTESYRWNSPKQRIDVDYAFDLFSKKHGHLPQKAFVVDKNTNAHWKVQFFGLFSADYLILAVDDDYRWAAVGVPSQRYLWILSDEPKLHEATIHRILLKIKEMGYRTDNVIPIKH